MTLVFFLILTAAWIVIFFPKVLGVRRSSPLPAAEMFRKRLDLLAPHPSHKVGRAVYLPQDPEQVRRNSSRRALARKRKILVLLLGVTVVSLPPAVLWPALWRINLAALALLLLYVAVLVGSRRRRQIVMAKVSPLPMHEAAGGRADRERASGGAR